MSTAALPEGYALRVGAEQMDVPAVHAFLTRTYWSEGIPLEVVELAVRHSLCMGVVTADGEQVAFARAITDQATFAYLADVYVLPEHRGRGLSRAMLSALFAQPGLQDLRRFMLATRDAHALYAGYGFTPLARPERMMERHDPQVYQRLAANRAD
jgi:GNAT superfamily N-acetyltransferase